MLPAEKSLAKTSRACLRSILLFPFLKFVHPHGIFTERSWRRRDSNPQPSACKAGALPIAPHPQETMQAPGNRPESANYSMRESNPHCSHADSQFCVSLLHSSGSGGNRTPDVSNVTDLQSAAFAARHTLPRNWAGFSRNRTLSSFPSVLPLNHSHSPYSFGHPPLCVHKY